jgi:hypothetical protein
LLIVKADYDLAVEKPFQLTACEIVEQFLFKGGFSMGL